MIFLVGLACGVAIALLPLLLDGRGYSKTDISSLAAWFALGIVVFALPMGQLIQRFSAKAVLVSALFLYAVTVAIFPYVTDNFALAALVRFFDGAASAGMWVGCETIVLSRAGKDDKAFVTSIYAVAIAIGYLTGPFVAFSVVKLNAQPEAVAALVPPFWIAGAISAATALLVLFRLDPDIEPDVGTTKSGRRPQETAMATVLYRIKTSCFGNFAYGYFQASMVLYLPLYLIASKGVTKSQTIIIPGFFALGMLLFVTVAGRFGDKHGHLLVMRVLAIVGSGTVLGFVVLDHFWLMCASVSVAGATLASISPISLALQGAILEPVDYGRGNALYNGFYAAGILLGPQVSSRLFQGFGGKSMLFHLAALWVTFVLFSLLFANDDPKRAAKHLALSKGGA